MDCIVRFGRSGKSTASSDFAGRTLRGAGLPALLALLMSLVLAWPSTGAAQEAEWIWQAGADKNRVPTGPVYFRRSIQLSAPESGQIAIVADDRFELYVNGRRVGVGESPQRLREFDISRFLNRGKNTIAVKATNLRGPTAAMAARVMVKQRSKNWESFSSNKTWRATSRVLPLWNTTVYNDRRWAPAQSFGKYGETTPWDKEEGVAKEDRHRHRSERFRVGEEFEVQRILDGEQTGSLIAMTFNEFGHVLASRENGPLLLIHDSNGDKQLDDVRIYCEKVKNCQGILALNGEVYVTGDGPDGNALYRLRDDDRDGTLENVKTLIKFTGPISEHGAHGIALGPDGLIYVVLGNHTKPQAGFDKKSPHRNYYGGDLLSPRYEDPGGHAVGVKAPGGTVIRTDVDGGSAQLVAGGLRNAYDLVFDRRGELFIHDSDMESDLGTTWYRPTQLYHITAGAEFGWRSGWAKWSRHYLDAIPGIVDTGRGSPTGALVYNHYAFPDRYHDCLFLADWSEGRILCVKPKREGATFQAQAEVFIQGSPLNVTDLDVGPDGAIYFATGGRGTNGGIYRVRWKGNVPSKISNLGTGISAVIRQPQLQSAWSRQKIAEMKNEIGDDWGSLLERVARSTANPSYYRTRALDLMQLFGPTPPTSLLIDLAKAKNEEVRAKVAEILGRHKNERAQGALIAMLDDTDRNVRRKVCEALLRFETDAVPADKVLQMLASDDRVEAWAARRLLERIPREKWQQQALANDNHRIFNRGSVALLIAKPDHDIALQVLRQSEKLMGEFVSDRDFIDMLRVMQIAILRGGVKPAEMASLQTKLAEEFPSSDMIMNRELIRLLAYLQESSIMDRYMAFLNSDVPIVDRLHVALHLRYIKDGWTSNNRLALLNFYEQAQNIDGGGSYALYIMRFTRDFAQSLSADEARKAVEQGADRPNTALAAMAKLPEEVDDDLLAKLISIDKQTRDQHDDVYKRLKVGIVAMLAQRGDETSMAHLRSVWEQQPERRQSVTMGLAQNPAGKNWSYLVRSLNFIEGVPAREVLVKLAKVPQRPTQPQYYRMVILAGLKLQDQGAADAVHLLQYWTATDLGKDKPLDEALAAWQDWFHKKYPDQQQAKLPEPPEGSKWTFKDLAKFLEGDEAQDASAERGAVVFTKAQCNKCHKFGNQGESMGPDLTTVSKRFMRKEVLESIYYPSLIVSDQYASKQVITTSGRTFIGIVAPGPQGQKILLQQSGEKIAIAEKDIDEIVSSKLSSMPNGLMNTLTLQEIADLFAYLGVMPQQNVARRK